MVNGSQRMVAGWWVVAVALFACSGGGEGGGGGPSDGAAVDGGAADLGLEDCAVLARWVITAVEVAGAACVGRLPAVGESVVVADGRLRVGERDLALGRVGAGCVVEASGCTEFRALGNQASITATLDLPAGRLVLDGQESVGFRPAACAPVTLTLAPAPEGCHLGGRFAVTTAPALVEGTCDLSWRPATVAISVATEPGDDRGELLWDDDDYAITAVDPVACTVTAANGLAFYNGVGRTIRITATVNAAGAEFSIADALDGTSDFDQTCVGARFAATGTVIEPGGEPWGPVCDALPFVCGDGICATDAGEQCEACPDDCGCDDLCVSYLLPGEPRTEPDRHACSAACFGGGCEAGERCVPAREFDVLFVNGGLSEQVCLAATGDAPRGGACTDSRGCADGLLCSDGQCLATCADAAPGGCVDCRMFAPVTIGACIPFCNPGRTDECGAASCLSRTVNHFCSTVDRESWFCHPAQFEHACQPTAVPGLGDACFEGEGCAIEGGCLKDDCVRFADNTFECASARCSQPCRSDDDCADPLPVCSVIEAPGRAPSRWCRAR